LKAEKVPAIAAGAAPSTRSRSDAARITGYRWLLVCIDGFSKFVFVKEIQQKAELDMNNKFLQPLDVKSYRGQLDLAMAVPDNDDELQSYFPSEHESSDDDDELQSDVVALPRCGFATFLRNSFGTPSELLRNTKTTSARPIHARRRIKPSVASWSLFARR